MLDGAPTHFGCAVRNAISNVYPDRYVEQDPIHGLQI
jgi:hypothetical protein